MVLDRLAPVPPVGPGRAPTALQSRTLELRRGTVPQAGALPDRGRGRGPLGTSRDAASARVFRSLRGDIVAAVRPGGSRLVELEIAEQYGVSRHAVRVAIRRLVTERLVDDDSASRWTVSSFTRSDASDLAEVQTLLDRVAARQAARRRSPHDLAAFARQTAAAARAIHRDDFLDLIRIGGRFRAEVYGATGNGALLQLHDRLHSRSLRLLAFADEAEVDPLRALHDFEAAFAARDADAAEGAAIRFNDELRAARRSWALRRLDEASGGFGREAGAPLDGTAAPGPVAALTNDLRSDILSGVRRPGAPLPTRVLAREHALGRAEVREALLQLAAEGLVALGPETAAARVRTIPDGELAEFLELAVLLDLLAVRLASARPKAAGLAGLEARLAVEERLAGLGAGHPSTREAWFAVRDQLLVLSGNRVLLDVGRLLEPRLRVLAARSPEALATFGAHRLVFEAVASRDFELLRRRHPAGASPRFDHQLAFL
ncbi:GntR family transcriptional regulator [Agromyces mediolanus]|uniref:GntR family transcriptional regulator n=1 Tax=Agromyces mediolanus TaxID=41986 RepID=UPI003833971C